ncbi:MAG: galactitol-1-phosphate 5-dehydrogenase [Ancrocorticia sp.]|uniref:galactitol-1-phosphate 5-dehydrogenase n=1 Tax=Ancrocorticia sp. TaxID=2593684 RepID=UPI003F933BF9
MHALTFWGVQDLRYEEVPDPVLDSPDNVIMKIKAVGVCGSDKKRYRKLGPYIPGNVWGHEFSGEIVEVGANVTSVKVGDRAAAIAAMTSEKSADHPSGRPSQDPNLSALGALVPGGYAEYIQLPEKNLAPMDPAVSFEEGALMEPTAVVLHGLLQTGLQMGDDVGIAGAGGLGLLAVAWARAFGAKNIYAFDIRDSQLELARAMGADVAVNTSGRLLHEVIAEYGEGVDLAVESAGAPDTSAQVLGLPKRGGEVVYMGIPYADITMPRLYFERIARYELTIHGTWSCVSAPYPGAEWSNALEMLANKRINIEPVISHKFNLSDGPEVFKKLIEEPNPYSKVMFYPEETQ